MDLLQNGLRPSSIFILRSLFMDLCIGKLYRNEKKRCITEQTPPGKCEESGAVEYGYSTNPYLSKSL